MNFKSISGFMLKVFSNAKKLKKAFLSSFLIFGRVLGYFWCSVNVSCAKVWHKIRGFRLFFKEFDKIG